MKDNNLIVITGAGASYGCYVPVEHFLNGHDEHNYRPPLTKHLFQKNPAFQEIRLKYRTVEHVAAEILAEQSDPNWTLENYMMRLKKDATTDPVRRRWYYETLFYLQDLLTTVSVKCLRGQGRGANAYTQLVGIVWKYRELFNDVCFLTLNYDTILDAALEDAFFHRFDDMSKYVSIRECKWGYVKLHGSCHWSRNIEDGASIGPMLDRSEHIERAVLDEISIFGAGKPIIAGSNRFPVIAAPVGEYEPICPPEHIDRIRRAIENKPVNVISIGFSGAGQDVFDLFSKSNTSINNVTLVEPNAAAFQALQTKFQKIGGTKFEGSYSDEGGFLNFVARVLPGLFESWKRG